MSRVREKDVKYGGNGNDVNRDDDDDDGGSSSGGGGGGDDDDDGNDDYDVTTDHDYPDCGTHSSKVTPGRPGEDRQPEMVVGELLPGGGREELLEGDQVVNACHREDAVHHAVTLLDGQPVVTQEDVSGVHSTHFTAHTTHHRSYSLQYTVHSI
ncbi:hypothetical protein ElyMa_002838800 [Elysia marginata]|uniref:Uncharacterized protein n=1 Tax=Elysia marginata TaxID=1093978 RepID=A0AAV4HY71_9GAST|nr:hypothetical protein ElyMa_002838800 [Elysia marginata]